MADDLRHTLVVLSDALAMGRAHCSSLQIARACIAEGKAQGEEAKMLCSVIANSLRFHREQYSNWQAVLRTLPEELQDQVYPTDSPARHSSPRLGPQQQQETQSTPMDTIPSPGLDAIMGVNGSPSGAADTPPVHATSSAEHGPPSIDLRPGGIGVSEMVTPTLMPAEISLESRAAKWGAVPAFGGGLVMPTTRVSLQNTASPAAREMQQHRLDAEAGHSNRSEVHSVGAGRTPEAPFGDDSSPAGSDRSQGSARSSTSGVTPDRHAPRSHRDAIAPAMTELQAALLKRKAKSAASSAAGQQVGAAGSE